MGEILCVVTLCNQSLFADHDVLKKSGRHSSQAEASKLPSTNSPHLLEFLKIIKNPWT